MSTPRRVLQWLGVTPTQREARLQRLLERAVVRGSEHRATVERVERLIVYRQQLGATSVDVHSLREAMYGEGDVR